MKRKTVVPLLLLLSLCGPVPAETTASDPGASDPGAENCPMTGAVNAASKECQVRRLAFRTELSACMEERKLASQKSRGTMNAQTIRARHLLCDAEVRAKLGVTSN